MPPFDLHELRQGVMPRLIVYYQPRRAQIRRRGSAPLRPWRIHPGVLQKEEANL